MKFAKVAFINVLELAVVLVLGVGLTQLAQAQTYEEKVVYSFTGVNGSIPEANLLLIRSNLYGTTYSGGASGDGTVFAVNKNTGTCLVA